MLKIFFFIFIILINYLWKYFEKPLIYLTIRKCYNKQSLSFLQTFLSLFSFHPQTQQECYLYKINLHTPIIFFLLKCILIFYCSKILVWFYKKQCYFILQKQIHPFIHIRSVALMSKKL